MIRIVVYTSGSACAQCGLTKQVMDAAGLVFVTINLSLPAHGADRAHATKTLGYSTVPVVVVDGHTHWAGFQPDAIKEVAARLCDVQRSGER